MGYFDYGKLYKLLQIIRNYIKYILISIKLTYKDTYYKCATSVCIGLYLIFAFLSPP